MKNIFDELSQIVDKVIITSVNFIAERVAFTVILQIVMVLVGIEFLLSPQMAELAVIVIAGYEYMYTKTVEADMEDTDSTPPD